MNDIEWLEARIRTLEKDLRLAQQTLRDQFAMAALPGILAYHGVGNDKAGLDAALQMAYAYAAVALEVRECPV
ncbi:hypothetical protein [Azonexus sp.]|uniref:hypothetical protein n=1 Tax=Azonexus sp. TaxID=1872668 RepID=UPI0027B889A0|nr:hypothetical protein [Azonexus sp.]